MSASTTPNAPGLSARLGHVRRTLRIVWAAAPAHSVAWAVLLLVQGLVPAGVVFVTKHLVDAVSAALGGGLSAENVGPALFWGAAMAGLLLLQQGVGAAVGYAQAVQAELVEDRIKGLIHAKANEADYAFYETAEYQNTLQQANAQASSRAVSLIQTSGTLGRDAVSFVSIAGILAASYAPWLPVALAVGTLPALLFVVRNNRAYRDWAERTTTSRREGEYFDHLLLWPEYVGEIRLFGFGEPLAEAYRRIRTRLRVERFALLRQQTWAGFAAGLIGLIVLGAILGWMAQRALQGRSTLGDLALFYQALVQGQGLLRSLLGGVGQIHGNVLFLEHLFRFLDLESLQRDPEAPAPPPTAVVRGVTFEGVTFAYPGAARPALRGLDVHFPAGQITAIVGTNGAGKSTLVKLLCRFYDPQGGRILIDGTDVRAFTRRDLLDLTTVLFQAPLRYQASAWDNIGLADSGASRDAIEAAARAAGAHEFLQRLPKGYDTRLGRMFYEGGELSGGQWQRVALARAYLRPAPVVVLDEPTSALDSWSEAEWFDRFRTLVAGRTAIVITHRFTVAMQAHVIHVMEAGRIVESGSHADLLALGGRYAQSWWEQTRQAESGALPEEARRPGPVAGSGDGPPAPSPSELLPFP